MEPGIRRPRPEAPEEAVVAWIGKLVWHKDFLYLETPSGKMHRLIAFKPALENLLSKGADESGNVVTLVGNFDGKRLAVTEIRSIETQKDAESGGMKLLPPEELSYTFYVKQRFAPGERYQIPPPSEKVSKTKNEIAARLGKIPGVELDLEHSRWTPDPMTLTVRTDLEGEALKERLRAAGFKSAHPILVDRIHTRPSTPVVPEQGRAKPFTPVVPDYIDDHFFPE